MSSHTRLPLSEIEGSAPTPMAGNRKAKRSSRSAKRRLPQRSAPDTQAPPLLGESEELLDWDERIDPPKSLSTTTLHAKLRHEPNPERRLYGDE
jgi:hypothetical protein